MYNENNERDVRDEKGRFKKDFIPWNKGIKTNKPPHNKLPTKMIECKCCGLQFEVNINSKQKYYSGHYQKLMSSDKNPAKNVETRNKIRNILIQTYKDNPSILENRKPSGKNQFSGGFSNIEKLIADELDRRNILFLHNYKVGRFFPDFIIYNDVIIECDGEYWHNDKEKENIRDRYLMDSGFFVFRLKGKRIEENPIKCISDILDILFNMNYPNTGIYKNTTIY